MNFTDKYIKMCEEATEIQDNWKPERGDRATIFKLALSSLPASAHGRHTGVYIGNNKLAYYPDAGWVTLKDIKMATFLPLQHQLQEILSEGVIHFKNKPYSYCEFINCWVDNYESYARDFLTFEELLLAIIMYEEYSEKKWNNTKEVWK